VDRAVRDDRLKRADVEEASKIPREEDERRESRKLLTFARGILAKMSAEVYIHSIPLAGRVSFFRSWFSGAQVGRQVIIRFPSNACREWPWQIEADLTESRSLVPGDEEPCTRAPTSVSR
jgi:hypothetical protein